MTPEDWRRLKGILNEALPLETDARDAFLEQAAERISAVDVIRGAAPIVGGGGGGRPTMARAGGKDPAKLEEALAEASRLVTSALTG